VAVALAIGAALTALPQVCISHHFFDRFLDWSKKSHWQVSLAHPSVSDEYTHMCRYGRVVVATPICSASEETASSGLSDGPLGSVHWALAMRRQRFFDHTS
jgi:hypothetical protein